MTMIIKCVLLLLLDVSSISVTSFHHPTTTTTTQVVFLSSVPKKRSSWFSKRMTTSITIEDRIKTKTSRKRIRIYGLLSDNEPDGGGGDCGDDDEKWNLGDNILWSSRKSGKMAAKCLPIEPNPDLTANDVITAIVRGLQYNNIPKVNSGLQRCYNFMDLKCIKLVTGYGNVPEERTIDKFVKYSLDSPKITPFMNTETTIIFGPLSRIPGTNTRGEIITMPIKLQEKAPNKEVLNDISRSKSEQRRRKTSSSNDKEDTGSPLAPQKDQKERTFMIRLEKQRRPPLTGSYIVTDIIDIATVHSISRPLNQE